MIQKNQQPIQKTACIVIPTYNESENIAPILDAIFAQEERKTVDVQLRVLVVDDSSPDGTADIVKEYRTRNPNVHLLLRSEKNGLGAAYIAGMKHALRELSPHIVMEMDADFSHNPADIYRLISEIENGADFVIGSRYVPGGSIPDDWGIHRKLISSAANMYAKTVLSIKDVKDCTGGFRAIRASKLSQVNFDALNVEGYVFQVSLLDAVLKKNADVREVPIAFTDRTAGNSKMSMKDILVGGVDVLRMGTEKWLADDPMASQDALTA